MRFNAGMRSLILGGSGMAGIVCELFGGINKNCININVLQYLYWGYHVITLSLITTAAALPRCILYSIVMMCTAVGGTGGATVIWQVTPYLSTTVISKLCCTKVLIPSCSLRLSNTLDHASRHTYSRL